MLRAAIIGTSFVASLGLLGTAPAQAKSKRHHSYETTQSRYVYRHNRVRVGGFNGPGTFTAAPRSYGADPSYAHNVPQGRPDSFQSVNGCYGGREQVRRGNRLVWVPDVTCPYRQDSF